MDFNRWPLVVGVAATVLLCIEEPALAFKPDVHHDLTKPWLDAVGLDRPVGDEIVLGNRALDELETMDNQSWRPITGGWDEWHFNDCAFSSAASEIQRLRQEVVEYAQAGRTCLAARRFGRMLHVIQDFYAHSNYVESGGRVPLSSETGGGGAYGGFPAITPYEPMGNWVFIEGAPPAGVELRREWKLVRVVDHRAGGPVEYRGIISGAVGTTMACPREIALGHWDGSEYGDGLGKDEPFEVEPARTAACEAFRVASAHTELEFRWFVSLPGIEAMTPEAKPSNWVWEEQKATSECLVPDRSARNLSPEPETDAPILIGVSEYQKTYRIELGAGCGPACGALVVGGQVEWLGFQAMVGYQAGALALVAKGLDGGPYLLFGATQAWADQSLSTLRPGAEVGIDWRPIGNYVRKVPAFLSLRLGLGYWLSREHGRDPYVVGAEAGPGTLVLSLWLSLVN